MDGFILGSVNQVVMTGQTSNELYDSLAPETCQELIEAEEETTVPAGARLVTHGEPLESLIIIKQGSVEISVPAGARAIFLAVAGRGKVLGLRGIVAEVLPEIQGGTLPEIDVTALEECKIATIARGRFSELLRQHPEIYFGISKVLSGDLKTAERCLRQAPRPTNGGRGGSPELEKRRANGKSLSEFKL